MLQWATMRSALRKVLKIGLGIVVSVVVLAVAAWLLRKPLFGALVKREIASALSDALGGRYEVGDLAGDWIRELRVRDVRAVEPPPDGPLTGLEIREVVARYDLRGLLSDDPLGAIDDLRVHGAVVDLDPARPTARAADGAPFEIPASLRPVVAVDATVRVAGPEGPAVFDGVRLAWGPGAHLSVDVEEVRLPERFDVRGPLAGRIEKQDDGSYRWTSDAQLGEVRVPEATFTSKGDVRARVEIADGRLDVAVADGDLDVRVDDVDVSWLPPWVRDRLPDAAPKAGRLTGRVTARLDDLPALAFDLVATDLDVRGECVARVEAKGRWDGRTGIDVDSLRARSEDATASARGVHLDLDLPWVLRDALDLRVEVGNLRAFVPELEREVSASVRASSLEPRRLSVDRLMLASGTDRVDAQGTVELPPRADAWRDARVHGTVSGSVGSLAPLDVALRGRMTFAGTVDGVVTRPGFALQVDGAESEVEGYGVGRGTLSGRLVDGGVEDLRVDVRGPFGEIRGTGTVAFEPLALDLKEVSVEVEDVRRLAERFAPDLPSLEGAVTAEGRVFYDASRIDVRGTTNARDLRVDGENVGTVHARIRSDGRNLHLEPLVVEGPRGRVSASGTVDPRARTATLVGLTYEGEAATVSLRRPLALAWSDEGIELTGLDAEVDGVRVEADGIVDPSRRRARLTRLGVRSAETYVRLRERLALAWTDGVLEVPETAVVVNGDVDARGWARLDLGRETAEVGGLQVTGDFGTLRLRAPVRLARRGDEIEVADLDAVFDDVPILGAATVHPARRQARLDVVLKGTRLRGQASWHDGLQADLEFEGLALADLVEGPTGLVRGWVRFGDDALTAEAQVEELGVGGWHGRASGILRQERGGPLRVERLRIDGPGGGSLEGTAVLPYRATERGLSYDAKIEPSFTLEGALGGLEAFTDVADGPARLRLRGEAGLLEGSVRLDDLLLCDEGSLCDDGIVHLRVTRDEASITVGLTSDEFAQVRGRLSSDRGFDWTRPGELAAFVDRAHVEGSIGALVRDWKPLAAAEPGFKQLRGAARVDLSLSGPLRNPQVRGVLTLQKFSLGLETDVAPFRDVDARFVFEDRAIRIEQLEGLMGYAPFSIGGEVRRPFGEQPELDLTLTGRNTQLLRTDWTRMRIDVDATITGPLENLLVKGEGRVVEATFREPVSLASAGEAGEAPEIVLFEILDWPFSEMRFDVGFTADESLRIRNNLVRANVSFEGRLQGTGKRPELVGRASFQKADIFLPLSTLRDGEGVVTFLEGQSFRPRVQMTAHTRTRGYELGVQIAGTVPDVNLYVFSEPRLDDEDAILMLTTGSTSAELADGGILGKALSGVLNVFGGSLFTTRSGEGEPGDRAFFERFQFTTDWEGTDIANIDGEIELTDRFFLHLGTDRFDATNFGLIWRLRFR